MLTWDSHTHIHTQNPQTQNPQTRTLTIHTLTCTHMMPTHTYTHTHTHTHTHTIMHILTQIDDYSLVQFHSLDVSEEDTIGDLLMYIDTTIQYGEDLDVRVPRVGTHTHLHSLPFRVIQPRPLVLLPDSLLLCGGSPGMRLPRPLVSL